MKKHELFEEFEGQKTYQKRGLRQIMIDNDHFESNDQTKKRVPSLIMIMLLLLLAFGIIFIL